MHGGGGVLAASCILPGSVLSSAVLAVAISCAVLCSVLYWPPMSWHCQAVRCAVLRLGAVMCPGLLAQTRASPWCIAGSLWHALLQGLAAGLFPAFWVTICALTGLTRYGLWPAVDMLHCNVQQPPIGYRLLLHMLRLALTLSTCWWWPHRLHVVHAGLQAWMMHGHVLAALTAFWVDLRSRACMYCFTSCLLAHHVHTQVCNYACL